MLVKLTSGVDFTNILQAAFTHLGVNFINVFTYKCFVQTSFWLLFLVTFWLWRKICTKNEHKKCWWNWPQIPKARKNTVKPSVFFCASAQVKAECKMLMTLTPAVNFINIKRAIFLYKRCFSSYVLTLSKNSYEKFVRKTLVKLTPGWLPSLSFPKIWCQFHQRFLCAFFVRKLHFGSFF